MWFKERCSDCVCLVEQDGDWFCDEAQECCEYIGIKDCPEGVYVDVEDFPLYGLIYNWKGLKEENYLYTWNQISSYDDRALKGECFEGGFCGNKTYEVYPLESREDVISFLNGSYNDVECFEKYEDWYWNNSTTCLFTNQSNPTMKYWINEANIITV